MNRHEKIYTIYSVIANAVFYVFFGVELYAVYKNIFDLLVVDIFIDNFSWFYLPVFISFLWSVWLWFKEKSKSRLVKLMFFISVPAVLVGSWIFLVQLQDPVRMPSPFPIIEIKK